jgi:hypothetical protein
MNKNNAKEYLPLVKALAEGKTVQISASNGQWTNPTEVEFTLAPNCYRVKPEPKIVWVNYNTEVKTFEGPYYRSIEAASSYAEHGPYIPVQFTQTSHLEETN